MGGRSELFTHSLPCEQSSSVVVSGSTSRSLRLLGGGVTSKGIRRAREEGGWGEVEGWDGLSRN